MDAGFCNCGRARSDKRDSGDDAKPMSKEDFVAWFTTLPLPEQAKGAWAAAAGVMRVISRCSHRSKSTLLGTLASELSDAIIDCDNPQLLDTALAKNLTAVGAQYYHILEEFDEGIRKIARHQFLDAAVMYTEMLSSKWDESVSGPRPDFSCTADGSVWSFVFYYVTLMSNAFSDNPVVARAREEYERSRKPVAEKFVTGRQRVTIIISLLSGKQRMSKPGPGPPAQGGKGEPEWTQLVSW